MCLTQVSAAVTTLLSKLGSSYFSCNESDHSDFVLVLNFGKTGKARPDKQLSLPQPPVLSGAITIL